MSNERHVEYLLRLGDNTLVSGQRLGEWVTKAPELEEEMALANFALDYIGQARLIFSHAATLEGRGRDEDQLAFLRDQIDFRNVLLVEQPNGDFGHTLAKQFLFLSFYQLQLEALSSSTDNTLAEIATRTARETRYQLRHTRQWLVRLGDGTDESHERMQAGIDALWRYTGELFTGDDTDRFAADNGIGPDPQSLKQAWQDNVQAALTEATLSLPDDQWMDSGGKQGRHSEHLGFLLAEMQFLQRAYPGAQW